MTEAESAAGGFALAGGRPIPDLRYGEVEEELRHAVRSLLTRECPLPAVLAYTEGSQRHGGQQPGSGQPGSGQPGGGQPGGDQELGSSREPGGGAWPSLAASLGCAGLLIPESLGGAGASYREAAVVAEETGWAVAPVPYLGSAVVATVALLASGDELLRDLAGGRVTAALAVEFGSMPTAVSLGTASAAMERSAGTERLTGVVRGVADAERADVLLVPAAGVPFDLYAVDVTDPGVRRDPVVSLDQSRPLTDLTLTSVPGRRVAAGDDAARAIASALTAGTAMLACELLGTGDRCLEMTLAYVRERRQFGRAVGSFQALKHRLADVWVALTQARAAARYAAACLATADPDTPVAVALAKAACGDAAVHAAQECVQMHGGIGFTWEHPAHLLLKRAKSASLAFGAPDQHRWEFAGLANLPPPGRHEPR